MLSEFHVLPDYASSCNLFVQIMQEHCGTNLISNKRDRYIIAVKVLNLKERREM